MTTEQIQRACDADLYTNREDTQYLGAFARTQYTVEEAENSFYSNALGEKNWKPFFDKLTIRK